MAPSPSGTACLHKATARGDEADGSGAKIQRTAADQCRVLAEAVTGHELRSELPTRHTRPARRRHRRKAPPVACFRYGRAARPGLRASTPTNPDRARRWLRRRFREPPRTRPPDSCCIPSDCEPWPGKTNAVVKRCQPHADDENAIIPNGRAGPSSEIRRSIDAPASAPNRCASTMTGPPGTGGGPGHGTDELLPGELRRQPGRQGSPTPRGRSRTERPMPATSTGRADTPDRPTYQPTSPVTNSSPRDMRSTGRTRKTPATTGRIRITIADEHPDERQAKIPFSKQVGPAEVGHVPGPQAPELAACGSRTTPRAANTRPGSPPSSSSSRTPAAIRAPGTAAGAQLKCESATWALDGHKPHLCYTCVDSIVGTFSA